MEKGQKVSRKGLENMSLAHRGKKHLETTKQKLRKIVKQKWTDKKYRVSLSGCNSPNWKEKNIGYWAIHSWLKKTFGKANKCTNLNCKKKSKIYDYCLRKGFKHERKRCNYTRLCRSCHIIYDRYEK